MAPRQSSQQLKPHQSTEKGCSIERCIWAIGKPSQNPIQVIIYTTIIQTLDDIIADDLQVIKWNDCKQSNLRVFFSLSLTILWHISHQLHCENLLGSIKYFCFYFPLFLFTQPGALFIHLPRWKIGLVTAGQIGAAHWSFNCLESFLVLILLMHAGKHV